MQECNFPKGWMRKVGFIPMVVSQYCQTVYSLIAVLIFLLPRIGHTFDSRTAYENTVSRLAQMTEANQANLLYPSRNHKVYLHGQKRKCVVLQLHGLFQSPLDQRGFSEYLFKQGCNVVAPLLAGHWERNESAFQQLNPSKWIQQTEELLDLALNLGENLILVGHSTGGLLAFHLAERHPEKVNALVLFSPALQLTSKTILVSSLGGFLNLNQQAKTGIDHEYDTYKKPAVAGVRVIQLNQFIFGRYNEARLKVYQNFKTPTLIFSTEDDDVVSHLAVSHFQKVQPELISLVAYASGSGVFHDNIQRGPLDIVPTAPRTWTNPFYESVLSKTSDFLHSFIHP